MIYQHMRFTGAAMLPIGDFLAHVGDWTGLPPAELLGPDARRGAGVGGRVRRARRGSSPRCSRTPTRARSSTPTATRRDRSPSCARSTATSARAMSAYLDLVGCRLLDGFDISGRYALELPDALLRAIRVAVDGRRARRRRRRGHDRRASARRCPRSTARSSTSCSARRGSCTGCATSAASSATSGRPGIMRRAALAAGRRLAAAGRASTTPSTSSTPASTRCARWSPARAGRRPTSSRRGTPTAPRATRRTRRRPRRRRRPPPPDPSGLPPASARVMRAIGIAIGSDVRQLRGGARGGHAPRARRERGRLRRAGAPRLRARRVRPHPAGRRARHRVDDRGVQHPAAAARRDRHRQRRPALALGDRRARVRHPGRGRDARGDRPHPRRRARARRRRRRRSDGARRERTSSRSPRRTTTRSSARRRSGWARPARAGLPIPPGVALSGAIVDAVAARRRGRDRGGRRARARPLAGPLAVRSSAVDEDGADASFAGQHLTLLNVPSVDDVTRRVREIWWSANSDSAITYRQRVGLFTRPSVGVVVQSLLDPDSRRRDVHAEPDHRRRRAPDRGELGARRGGRRRPRDPRQLPHRPRRRGARAHPGAQEDRDPRRARRRHRRGGRRAGAASSSSASTTISSRSSTALADRCEEVYGPARDIEWAFAGGELYLLQCRAITRTRRPRRRWRRAPGRRDAARAVLRRARAMRARADRALFKERRFAAGETVIKEGVGRRRVLRDRVGRGDGHDRRPAARPRWARRLLRRDRADRRGRALGDDHGRAPTSSATGSPTGSSARSSGERAIGWKLLQFMVGRLRAAEARD